MGKKQIQEQLQEAAVVFSSSSSQEESGERAGKHINSVVGNTKVALPDVVYPPTGTVNKEQWGLMKSSEKGNRN